MMPGTKKGKGEGEGKGLPIGRNVHKPHHRVSQALSDPTLPNDDLGAMQEKEERKRKSKGSTTDAMGIPCAYTCTIVLITLPTGREKRGRGGGEESWVELYYFKIRLFLSHNFSSGARSAGNGEKRRGGKGDD